MDTEYLIDCKEFWQQFTLNYDFIYNFIKHNSNNEQHINKLCEEKIIPYLYSYLSEKLHKKIDFYFTFNQTNKQFISNSNDVLELYISPCGKKENVSLINTLVNLAPRLNNLVVVKYKPFNYSDDLINDIVIGNNCINYSDVLIQYSYGYTEEKTLGLNLVIMIDEKVIDKFYHKKTIKFPENNTSREVYIPINYCVVLIMLYNIIGEYSCVNDLCYIEILNSKDIENKEKFQNLSVLRDVIKNINKKYKFCNYCNRSELQKKLFCCSVCKNTYYCNRSCQVSNYNIHKNYCSLNIKN